MSDAVVVKTRKFKRNPLLSRRQMVVDIIHPGRANVAKSELQEVIGQMHKADPKLVMVFGCRTKFGGGKSTGFCLIYDTEEACVKFEPKYRLVRNGMFVKAEKSRKALKKVHSILPYLRYRGGLR